MARRHFSAPEGAGGGSGDAADRAIAGDPQPPAGGQLRLGPQRGPRHRLRADDRRPRTTPRRARRPALQRPPPRVAAGRAPAGDRTPPGAPGGGGGGGAPRGAGLAERVWEPSLPADLAHGGYEWTILDDNHLRAASVGEDDMWSAFSTDDQGERLTIFGTEAGLRSRIPSGAVDDLIGYLRDHATEDGGPPRARAIAPRQRGQSNDCYWHGLFGGIYLVHMRLATLSHLIAAEDLADADARARIPTGGATPDGARPPGRGLGGT